MLPAGPIVERSVITALSRKGSMGGLVTCAKCCLKKSNSIRGDGDEDMNASGVSLPMLPSDSLPSVIIVGKKPLYLFLGPPKHGKPLVFGQEGRL